MDFAAHQGERVTDLFPIENEQIASLIGVYADVVRTGQMCDMGELPFEALSSDGRVLVRGIYTMQVFPLANRHLCLLFEDVTERKQAQEAALNVKLQEDVIRTQNAALAELSTPLLALGNGVVVMPLVGTIDSRRAHQIMERLLEGVSETRARAVILDITGIPIVDTQVANVFIQAAQAVKLLGARVIITGIRPEVAQTLVGLGVDLSVMITRGTLENGLVEAVGRPSASAPST